ncbi:MAG: GGDEF domain-containing protein, partial [Fervidobacterium sp.]|nr:GGDEF domain-containing protein [Fervidobacterium sp.]
DQLTGAYNRKIIEKLDKNDGILVLLDLDGFKRMNDVYGHKKGDEILKRFSTLVMNNIRSDDYFIRLGGDEFCIITKSSDIKNQISRLYNIAKNEINLGFSYGIVDLSEYNDFDKAYMKADEELYKHKWSKKDQPY